MSARYTPGAAYGAHVEKEGAIWTLVLVRDLRHPPPKVWEAITDPQHLREWAPFDADRNIGTVGKAKLSTANTPQPHVTETEIRRAEPARLLEFNWGGQEIRWQLEKRPDGGTRLTIWHAIDRRYIAMGAAGWHICFDVLDRFLGGEPIGRIVGPDAMQFDGWQRLRTEYAQQFEGESS